MTDAIDMDNILSSLNDPWIKILDLELNPPSLGDNLADSDRIIKEIKRILSINYVDMPVSILRKELPTLLRKRDFKIKAVGYEYRDTFHIIEILPMNEALSFSGIAIDLGTSSVVLRVIDLVNKRVLRESSFANPQNQSGADILTRIHIASDETRREEMKRLLVDRINKEIHSLTGSSKDNGNLISGISISGNTTMIHLFLGLNPYYICREPYIPVVNQCQILRADEVGFDINPLAPVMIMPSVGSYLGGDIISGIIATGITDREDISLLVDVGTNAEVVVGNRDWLVGCAGAAGPALEGGVASSGMMAGEGVIDRIRIDPDTKRLIYHTIGDKKPIGICGSGLIDLIAWLFRAGMIDYKGRFVQSKCGERLKEIDGIKHFVLVPAHESAHGRDITINQAEIDSIIRSKAGMFTILKTITEMINIEFKDIKNIYVGGTFGSFIDPNSAITIGMLPDLPRTVYKPVGNTSLMGAQITLLSQSALQKSYRVRDMITYVELNVNQRFMELFASAKFLPHADRSLFPSVNI